MSNAAVKNGKNETLDQLDIQFAKGVGPRLAPAFQKLGINAVSDLLYHLPRRYEDRTRFAKIGQLQGGEAVTLKGRILSADSQPSRSGMTLVRAHLDDGSGIIELIFFNQRWMKDRLLHKKNEFVVFGQVQQSGWGLSIANPEWEEIEPDSDALAANRIVPIYPLTEGITQRRMRTILWNALEQFLPQLAEPLPADLRERYKLGGLQKCLRQAHFPDKEEYVGIARRRLIFEEFLALQLSLAAGRAQITLEPGIAFVIDDRLMESFQSHLPFQLTGAQRRVIGEIWDDMRRPQPMNRLVQGDVGSGKTVVAASAIVAAINAGYQTALMAPTEILAEQHHRNIAAALAPFGIVPELLVGRLTAKQKERVRERLSTGHSQMAVGTHALIQDGVEFGRLGLVVIDEQHRFGVMQRASLMQKGVNPDVLVMTATPIPRTLTMTLYGDLDLSIIDELPVGRKPIKTKWKRPEDRPAVYEGIRTLVSQGQQAYIVCPLVEESEKLQARAATAMAEHLQADVFPELTVGLLHGQMKPQEKDEVMDRFRRGETHVLVATTVIEVGVDVPNATVMVIEDAHRFGLAQLHQLRGRVGRGAQQSYCILVSDPSTDDGVARMTTMVQTNDGFIIAEEDLRLRGPGEVHGLKQSGIPAFKVGDLVKDQELLAEARTVAYEIVGSDPTLSRPENAPYRTLMERSPGKVAPAAVG